jgi:peroxiredoxin
MKKKVVVDHPGGPKIIHRYFGVLMKAKYGVAGFVFAVSALAAQVPDSTTWVVVGQAVPRFSVSTLDGKIIQMPDLDRRAVLLTFFATWCAACDMEMPELENQIWQKYKKRGLLVLALGREHSEKELNAFVKEKNLTFPVASDPKRELFGKFARQNIPRNVLVDKNGVIVYSSVGYEPDSFQKLITAIEQVLSK